MDRQEIFDKVATHLLTQNRRATVLNMDPDSFGDDEEICQYRTPDGRKCAVGCLITDAAYTSSIEGYSVDVSPGTDAGRAMHRALAESGVDIDNDKPVLNLLSDLQITHDRYQPDEWREKLGRVATDHGLHFEQPA